MKTVPEPQQFDVVRILKPVSGISECEEKPCTFPAGTRATILDIYEGHQSPYLVEISWLTSPVSEDGLLVGLAADEFEVVWRAAENLPPAEITAQDKY